MTLEVRSRFPCAVIGAGDVVRGRYLAAFDAQDELELRWIFDVVDPFGGREPRLRRIPDSPSAAVAQIRSAVPTHAIIIIATPTPLHLPYTRLLAPTYPWLSVEKPACTSVSDLDALDAHCRQAGGAWFPLAYYLLEKGLPLMLVSGRGLNGREHDDLVVGDVGHCRRLTSRLGPLRAIRGCIFEGAGTAGQLDERAWVLSSGGGGNTWETLFHLTSLVAALTDGEITVEEVRPARADQSPGHLDTANWVRGRAGSVRFDIAAAKYIAVEDDQRWLVAEYDNGTVTADFESCSVEVGAKNGHATLRLRRELRYATQLALLAAWREGHTRALPYRMYRRATELTQAVAGAGARVVTYPRRVSPQNIPGWRTWRGLS